MIRVAIVGKVNSGKSTLFNALVGSDISITWKEPATTRDTVEAIAHSKNTDYIVSDTAGYYPEGDYPLRKIMEEKTEEAIQKSDIVIVVFDAKSGYTNIDKSLRDRFIKGKKPFIFVVNKVDNEKDRYLVSEEFSKLGAEFITISALHKKGIDKLLEKLDEIANNIKKNKENSNEVLDRAYDKIKYDKIQKDTKEDIYQDVKVDVKNKEELKRRIRVSFIGRPNVGKSSLVNAVLGYPRCIVYEEPGTTRDTIRIPFWFDGNYFILVDTPGIRRKSRIVKMTLEEKSVRRSLSAISASNVCVLVIDATEGITHQDKTIAEIVQNKGYGLVVAINKIDLIKKLNPAGGIKKFISAMKFTAPFLHWCEFIPVSAVERDGIPELLQAVVRAYDSWKKRLKPSQLLKIRQKLMQLDFMIGQNPKIFQVRTCPPTFTINVKNPLILRKNQIMHVGKIIRELYGFEGSPIKFEIKRHTY